MQSPLARTATVIAGVAMVMWIVWVIMRRRNLTTPLPHGAACKKASTGRIVFYPDGGEIPRACAVVLCLDPSTDGNANTSEVLIAGLHVWDGMGHEITPPPRTSSGIVRRIISGTAEQVIRLRRNGTTNRPENVDIPVGRIALQKMGDSPMRIVLRDAEGLDVWMTNVGKGTIPGVIEFELGRPDHWKPFLWDAERDPSVLNPYNVPAAVGDKVSRWMTVSTGNTNVTADTEPSDVGNQDGIFAAVWNFPRLVESSRDGRLAIRCDRTCTLLGAPGFPVHTRTQFDPLQCAIFIVFEVLGSASITNNSEPLDVFFIRPHTLDEQTETATSEKYPIDRPAPLPLYALRIERDPRTGSAIFVERMRLGGPQLQHAGETTPPSLLPVTSSGLALTKKEGGAKTDITISDGTRITLMHHDTPVHGHRFVYAAQYALQPNGKIEHRSMLRPWAAMHRSSQPAPSIDAEGTEYHMVLGCVGGCTGDPNMQQGAGGAVAYHEIRIYPQTMNDTLMQSVHEELSQKWDTYVVSESV